MSARSITNEDLSELISGFEHAVFRSEQQPSYLVPEETESVQMFLDGIDHDPLAIPYFRTGFAAFAEVTASGRTMQRVRLHDTPLTDYQRWLRWLGKWNADAGEQIAYLDRSVAIEAELAPASGFGDDFWLFDDRHVVTMRFGGDNSLVDLTLTDSPQAIADAIEWRRRALELAEPPSLTPA